MQPQQPYQQPGQYQQPPVQPDYSFITDPGKPPHTKLPIGGNSIAARILVVVGGLFVLILIIGFIIKLLSGSGGGLGKASLVGIAQDQTQILHLSDSGTNYSVADANKNAAYTVQLSLQSQQTAYLAYLKANGIKASSKQLSLKQDAQVDSALTAAQNASTFDSTYTPVIEQALTTYRHDLSAAYPKAGPKLKVILSDDYNAVNLLLKQLSNANTN